MLASSHILENHYDPLLISTRADLDKYPALIPQEDSKPHHTIGDLHACSLKMIYFLIRHRIFTFESHQYLALAAEYKKLETEQTLKVDKFQKLLAERKVTEGNINRLVRFLGDTIGDRSTAGDIPMLLCFEAMEGIPFENLFSNHDAEFIINYEKNTLASFRDNLFMGEQFCKSLLTTQKMLHANPKLTVRITELMEKHYKPHLKLLSYSIVPEQPGKKPEINIYSHAPICLETIARLAEFFKTPKRDIRESIATLTKTIDEINAAFYQYRDSNKIHTLLRLGESGAGNSAQVSTKYPLERIIWNREITSIDIQNNQTPAFDVNFYHGHTKAVPYKNYHSYDNSFAKDPASRSGILDAAISDNTIPQSIDKNTPTPLDAAVSDHTIPQTIDKNTSTPVAIISKQMLMLYQQIALGVSSVYAHCINQYNKLGVNPMPLTLLKQIVQQDFLSCFNSRIAPKEEELTEYRGKVNNFEELTKVKSPKDDFHVKRLVEISNKLDECKELNEALDFLIDQHKNLSDEYPTPTLNYEYSKVIAAVILKTLSKVSNDQSFPQDQRKHLSEYIDEAKNAKTSHSFGFVFGKFDAATGKIVLNDGDKVIDVAKALGHSNSK